MRLSVIAVLAIAIALLEACSDSLKPAVPAFGYYALHSVDGHPLPATHLLNSCPVSFTSGYLKLQESDSSFVVHLAWQHACTDTLTGLTGASSAFDCVGFHTFTGVTSFVLSGHPPATPLTCDFMVNGYGSIVKGRYVGANQSIWGDPQFELGPRQESAPGP